MEKQVSENPEKNREKMNTYLFILTAILITLYISANVMSVKIISLKNVALFDAGTLTFPFTYMLGDVLTEIWGFKKVKKIIFLTFFCNILFVACTAIPIFVPAPEYMRETTNAYSLVFNYVPRIVIASLIAFLSGELINSWSMEQIKKRTGKRLLFVRTIGSSVFGYIADTVIFVVTAFIGISPTEDLLSMIGIQFILKLGIEAFFGTPLAYLVIHKLNKFKRKKDPVSK